MTMKLIKHREKSNSPYFIISVHCCVYMFISPLVSHKCLIGSKNNVHIYTENDF